MATSTLQVPYAAPPPCHCTERFTRRVAKNRVPLKERYMSVSLCARIPKYPCTYHDASRDLTLKNPSQHNSELPGNHNLNLSFFFFLPTYLPNLHLHLPCLHLHRRRPFPSCDLLTYPSLNIKQTNKPKKLHSLPPPPACASAHTSYPFDLPSTSTIIHDASPSQAPCRGRCCCCCCQPHTAHRKLHPCIQGPCRC